MTTPLSIVSHYSIVSVASDVFLISHRNAHILQTNAWAAAAVEILQSGIDVETLIELMHQQSGLEHHKISEDLTQLLTELEDNPVSDTIPALCSQEEQPPASIREEYSFFCGLGGKTFKVVFDNSQAQSSNERLLAPLCVTHTPQHIDHVICCSDTGTDCGIWLDGKAIAATKDTDWLHGLLRRTLIKQAYGENSTTVTLHAAAMSYGGKTLLFIGPSGAGKSSLTRHFCNKGFKYLGDDSIPVDVTKNIAYPMPTGVSLKPGSWTLDSDIDTGKLGQTTIQLAGKTFKTWQPEANNICHEAKTIDAIVYSRYIEGCELHWRALTLKEAIAKLDGSQTRFNPDTNADTSAQCLHWLSKVPSFSLLYSNLSEAFDTVTQQITTSCSHD